jgi:integrase/recombinase XerC
MLLVEAMDSFAKNLRRRGYSIKTIDAYLFDLKKFSVYLKNTRNIDEASIILDDIDIEAIRGWIDNNLESDISLRTVSRRLSTIKSLFHFLFSENLIDDRIKLERIQLPRIQKKPPQVLAQEEVYELFDIQDVDDPNHLMYQSLIILMYSCGLRVGEASSLRIRDLDLSKKSIRVLGKGAKERIIPLQNAANRSLLKYLEQREKTYPESLSPDDSLFYKVTKSGFKPMNIRRIQYLVEKRGESAGLLKHVHPHLLRHSIATHMIERGANVESVRQTLGHENLATTSIYIKSSSKFLREEHNKFNPIDSLIK